MRAIAKALVVFVCALPEGEGGDTSGESGYEGGEI
jgi:hypothetical protein